MSNLVSPKHRHAGLRLLAWALAIVAALGVFMAYLDPQLMVALGNAVWSCF